MLAERKVNGKLWVVIWVKKKIGLLKLLSYLIGFIFKDIHYNFQKERKETTVSNSFLISWSDIFFLYGE